MDSLSLPDLFASRSPSGTGAICSPTSAPYRGQRAPATDDNSGDDKPAEFKTDSVFPSHASEDQITFNASGTVIAARDGRTVTLWDIAGKRKLARLAHNDVDSAVAFSPDGEHVATTDGTFVRVWKTDGREVAKIEHLSTVTQVAFSPDGDLLSFARVTPGGDSAIHLLLWRPEQLTREACQRLTRNLDEGEWRGYIGTEPYRKTCPSLR